MVQCANYHTTVPATGGVSGLMFGNGFSALVGPAICGGGGLYPGLVGRRQPGASPAAAAPVGITGYSTHCSHSYPGNPGKDEQGCWDGVNCAQKGDLQALLARASVRDVPSCAGRPTVGLVLSIHGRYVPSACGYYATVPGSAAGTIRHVSRSACYAIGRPAEVATR